MLPNFLTVEQASKTWRRSPHTIKRRVQSGYIPSAVKAGKTWLIPLGTAMPTPPRGAAAHKPKESKP